MISGNFFSASEWSAAVNKRTWYFLALFIPPSWMALIESFNFSIVEDNPDIVLVGTSDIDIDIDVSMLIFQIMVMQSSEE
jgi:hypothetical protein